MNTLSNPSPLSTTNPPAEDARRPRRRATGWLAGTTAALMLATLSSTTTPSAVAAPESSKTQVQADQGTAERKARRGWRRAVTATGPVAHLRGTKDLTSGRVLGTRVGDLATTRMPNGAMASKFDGRGDYVSFPSRAAYSIATTGQLTIEYWMRPDALQFPDSESSGYVYVLGKGDPNRHEYYGRMYNKSNSESRPNRISGYAFNPTGGLGAGSYFQDTVTAGQWIHVTLVFDVRPRSGYPTGTVSIYKNGVLRDTDGLDGYNITPRAGSAPFRVGTGYLGSFFQGAVGDVVFYDRALSGTVIKGHYTAMRG